ncbi:MAG: tyrosine-type recombinase/integrase [Verrucomicrobiales bacterium]|nr:tyrosine-type recombinase/integrase [Verrucomicrobiales bacterium]
MHQVVGFWKRNGLKFATAKLYEIWVLRFLKHYSRQKAHALRLLTVEEVKKFATGYARRHRISLACAPAIANSALRAWSVALSALGFAVPVWRTPCARVPQLCPLLREYVAFRERHSSALSRSIKLEVDHIAKWLAFLKHRGRKLRAVHLMDVDDYLVKLRRRYAVSTAATLLSSLRLFLRFLHHTGRVPHDLASSIQSPPRRRIHLPRALPWTDVQRILKAVDRRSRLGLRDYAMLLLMSLYGMGSAEIMALTLDQIRWENLTFTVVRPKTGESVDLPLLPAAARALSAYLKHARPSAAPTRSVFVSQPMPYRTVGSKAIRRAIRKYARKAGVNAKVLGGHAFRYSHASRQIDQEAPPKVLSSILGHRNPESTSAYTRVAVKRLRGIALPVPR